MTPIPPLTRIIKVNDIYLLPKKLPGGAGYLGSFCGDTIQPSSLDNCFPGNPRVCPEKTEDGERERRRDLMAAKGKKDEGGRGWRPGDYQMGRGRKTTSKRLWFKGLSSSSGGRGRDDVHLSGGGVIWCGQRAETNSGL